MASTGERMEDARAYLSEMQRLRGYTLDYHQVLVAEDLTFMRAVNDLLAVSYTDQRRLDRKTKELVLTAVRTALGAGKEHVKAHIEVAKREGATKEEVLELLELVMLPCGAPKFMLGYEAWLECFPVKRIDTK